ncbi:MAG: YceI family protein [Paracoccaceae bacterium]|nr:YceI family protein [Paracoccaceae bacterium]
MGAVWRQAGIGALAAVLALFPGLAVAMEWALVPERSRIGFEYLQNGQRARGIFARYHGEGLFSPEAPEAATLELRIESASIDLDDNLASAFATSAEWFDAATHPLVTYRLTSLSPLGGDRFHAIGDLTIRGRTRAVRTEITLMIDGAKARAEGVLELDRRDFGLGVGPSALFVEIGRAVAVRFDLTAMPPE